MNINGLIIYEKTIPQREAQYADMPEGMNPEIRECLARQGIDRLYIHQAEMFREAVEKKNVVITTSTASGKTLSFLLPVLQEILSNPASRAVFIYPTKALAADQYRALQPWLAHFGRGKVNAGVYDGDTTVQERSRIRKQANILLTNPEMLNGAMLPNHSKYGFDFIFANLKFVVLDELHTYRGAFGSHLANVFRRLGRVCRYYHSSPQFLCSSATIANPVELAGRICGQSFVCISHDGSGASERKYCLIQPPKITGNDRNYYGQQLPTTIAADLLPELMERGESFIAFARSRKNVEVILKETRDRLEGESFFGNNNINRISGYRGGYTPVERKEIENRMISGDLLGLVSTNALELGIDIGKISATVLVGYPGTRASFWQQTGRAGRGRDACTNYMILDNMPMDQYIGLQPDWIFAGSSENAIVDPDNLLIELAHIRAAAAEIPLSLDDMALFPDLGETIPVLLKAEELKSQNGRFVWSGGEYPAGDFSMRNIDKNKYKLLNRENGTNITEMDESQAFRELHEGAVYMHDGVSYQILQLDLESRTAYAVPFSGNYYTQPGAETNIHIIHSHKQQEWKNVKIDFGDINVSYLVYMYKKLQFHNHQNLGHESLRQQLTKKFDTESTWLKLPENVVRVYRGLLQPGPDGLPERNNHFEGLCFALKNAAQMVTMTEKDDIEVIFSDNALSLSGESDEEVFLYFYDCYVGGLGFSEKIYDSIPQVVEQAVSMVRGCQCRDGCAACVGDYRLNRRMVQWGLENLMEVTETPQNTKVVSWAPAVWRKKEFRLQELPEKWQEFCGRVKENGEAFAGFLTTVSEIETNGATLCLYVDSSFNADWAMEEENRRNLTNIISYYVESPSALQLEIRALQQDGASHTEAADKQDKMMRRYQAAEEKEIEKEYTF